MKLIELNVEKFRNLKEVNIKFWDINIITWKNWSWKTNFLNLIKWSFSSSHDAIKDFWHNIVTYWRWYRNTEIVSTFSVYKRNIWFSSKELASFFSPEEFVLRRKIWKNKLSKFVSIDYKWKYLEASDSKDIYNEDSISWFFAELLDAKSIKIKWAYSSKMISVKDDEFQKEEWVNFLRAFKSSRKSIVSFNSNHAYSDSSRRIHQFVVWNYDLNWEEYETRKKIMWESLQILRWEDMKRQSSFNNIIFPFLLAEIQKEKSSFQKMNKDLMFYTQWIINKIYINTNWSKWTKWEIYVESNKWPKELEMISSWTAIIIFFVLIKNRLLVRNSFYNDLSVLIFDELDSAIHPNLIWRFSELLYDISSKVQLFITTHWTNFIDQFDRKDLFYIMDEWSVLQDEYKSNILNYKDIVKEKRFSKYSNSELLIDWIIENLFHS
jgi:predicted ATP-dependent endonuclease of OLD family